MKKSLDTFIVQPSGKKEYLSSYGWHFSKKAYLYAVSLMRKKDSSGREKEIDPYGRDEMQKILDKNGVKLDNNVAYDGLYVLNMAKADYLGSSIEDEYHLAKFVKDFLDDTDGGTEKAFRHWYSDMIESGTPIIWEDLI